MTNARQAYVNAVARQYVRLPGTPLRASRRDRKLATELYDRGVPLRVVWAAFVIAAARWTIRAPQQRKLDAIRTLYYFVPAIDEVLSTSPDPGYVQYVAGKLRPLVAEKERLLAAAGRLSARTPGRHMPLPRSCIRHPLHPAPLSRSCSRRGSCSGYAVLRGEKAPDDALARELGAMGLL